MDRDQRLLIVITGPVGGGKSSTGVALARALRQHRLPTAIIDLDEVYRFVRQQDGYDDHGGWKRARVGAAALSNSLFDADMSAVIIEGEFFTADELETLVSLVSVGARTLFFTVSASYEQCLLRAQGDPARGLSKDPAILRRLHEMFVQALPFLENASAVINTNALTGDEVVARLFTRPLDLLPLY